MMRRTFSVLLVLAMVMTMLAFGAAQADSKYKIDENGVLVEYVPYEGKAVVPNGVKAIGEEAFYCKHISSVTIPEGVTTIMNRAFIDCSQMTTVKLPDSLTSIGDYGFSGCYSLETINFPKKLKTIGAYAFYGHNYSLRKVVLPDSLTSIGERAFTDSNVLEEITLSRNLTYLGEAAFAYCGSLKSITIPSGITSIKDAMFYQCYNLEKVVMTDSVTSIGADAFAECYDLTIYAPAGSYAEKYAKKHGIPFVSTSKDPTSVSISQGKSAKLYMGNTLKLKAKLAPSDAVTTLSWSSSKKAVATVSKQGEVTPKKAGKTEITVKTGNKLTAKITVEVIDVKSVGLKEGKTASLKAGKKLTLHAKLSPSKVKTKLTWKSSDEKVATVSKDGVVTAKAKGAVTITATTANGKKASIKITVK